MSARAELEAYGGGVPNMQPLIKQRMSALGKTWPVPVQDTEGKGELGAFFARLRGGPRDEDQHQPRGLDAALASMRATQMVEDEALLARLRVAQTEEELEESRGPEAMLARMREVQRKEDERQSRELEVMFAKMREAQRDEDQQHTRKVDAAIARKRAAQKDENEYHPHGLEAALARMRVEDQFAELGLFEARAATPRSATMVEQSFQSSDHFPLPSRRSVPATRITISQFRGCNTAFSSMRRRIAIQCRSFEKWQ